MTELMSQLGLVFFALVVFILLALRLRLAPVIGLLIAGAIIGPNLLNLVSQSEYIYVFAGIGSILLLFFVGMEFSIRKIAKTGLRSFIVWIVKDGLIFLGVYCVSSLFGLDNTTALILASTLMISSTTFFIKLVKDRKLGNKPETNLIFVVLILEDLFAIFLLAIYSSMANGGQIENAYMIALSILKALGVLVIAYVVLEKLVLAIFEKLIKLKNDETMLFFSLSLAIFLSFFASAIGLASGIGAFLAGNMLSSVKGFKRTQDTLTKFSTLFSSFFFLSIGMLINMDALFSNIAIILALFVLLIMGLFSSVCLSAYLTGLKSRSAVSAGLLILSVGEFSLLIATQTRELIAPFDILSIVSALVFLTALSGNILIQYSKTIEGIIKHVIPDTIRKPLKHISIYFHIVLREFGLGGRVYTVFVNEAKKSVLTRPLLILIAVSGLLGYGLIMNSFPEYGSILLIAGILLGALPFVSIAYSIKEVIECTVYALHKGMHIKGGDVELAIRDASLSILMGVFAFIVIFGVAALNLPQIFEFFFIIPLFFASLFLWGFLSTLKRMLLEKAAYLNKEDKRLGSDETD